MIGKFLFNKDICDKILLNSPFDVGSYADYNTSYISYPTEDLVGTT